MALTTDDPITELGLTKRLTDDLTRNSFKTIGSITMRTAAGFLDRMRFRAGDMAAITEALAARGFEFAPPIGNWNTCGSCPTCPDCGNPRAQTANAVAVDYLGRARHLGGGTNDGPCHGCDEYHRDLVATRAVELAGSLM